MVSTRASLRIGGGMKPHKPQKQEFDILSNAQETKEERENQSKLLRAAGVWGDLPSVGAVGLLKKPVIRQHLPTQAQDVEMLRCCRTSLLTASCQSKEG